MVIQQNQLLLLLTILIVVGQCLPEHGSDTSQWLSNRTDCYLRYSLSWVSAYLSMVQHKPQVTQQSGITEVTAGHRAKLLPHLHSPLFYLLL